jgi:rare lipoprotein A
MKQALLFLIVCALLPACSSSKPTTDNDYTYSSTPRSEAVGVYKVGNPYYVSGVRYVPVEDTTYDQTGIASWYGSKFHGLRTANGEVFDMNLMTAAHTTLPMPSMVKVTNLQNGRSVVVRVNDRGPFVDDRIIDMSRRAARELGFEKQGTTKVRVQYQGPAVGAAAKPEVAHQDLTPVNALPEAELPEPLSRPEQTASRPLVTTSPLPQTSSAFGPSIHIQLGAFSSPDNAARMQATVSDIHAAQVHQALVDDQQLFRVRVGPFATVEAANVVHAQLLEAGYSGARITLE